VQGERKARQICQTVLEVVGAAMSGCCYARCEQRARQVGVPENTKTLAVVDGSQLSEHMGEILAFKNIVAIDCTGLFSLKSIQEAQSAVLTLNDEP